MSYNISNHQKIVPECKGCARIFERYDEEIVCSCNCYPDTKWWYGTKCPDATTFDHEELEDPIKEP
jgi:hypothetical protein